MAAGADMRAGLLIAGLFPVMGVLCIFCMKKYFEKIKG